eukprot:COSAG02_NODE_12919_length_1472_cov_1.332119_1_plen_98_part_00
MLITKLCVLRTFGGVDFSLTFICGQYVSEFLWDRLRASIQFPVMPKRAQDARFSGEYRECLGYRVPNFHWESAAQFGLEQEPEPALSRTEEITMSYE